MAEKIAVVEDYLTCAVCLETFKEPLTLGCNHSFCSDCLYRHWQQNNTKNCPVCRRKSSKEIIVVNFALKELCISFTEKQKSEDRAVCGSHPQVPPLFCKDEARLLCPVCEFSQHRDHTVVPLEQAEKELKEQGHSQLQALRRQRAEAKTLEQVYRDTQQHARRQAELCERQIRAEFDRLHRFLKEEEEVQHSALREEKRRQTQSLDSEVGRLKKKLASLDQNIQELVKRLEKKAEDFLLSYSQAQGPKLPPEPLPSVGPGLLINQAKILGNLGFRIWRKMKEIIQNCPVILDPNTAGPRLSLSDNLTSLAWADTCLQVLDNPERFSECPLVLGSDGFSSGRHQWDVEVGDHPTWLIGVAKEPINRKTKPNFVPELGFWSLGYLRGQYYNGSGRMILIKQPQKIRVQLDVDSGTVSFFDYSDMSLIFTHKDLPKEKLFPCFSLRHISAKCQTNSIRICAMQV